VWIVESAAAVFGWHANSERDDCPDGHCVANGNTERHADVDCHTDNDAELYIDSDSDADLDANTGRA
jgi:hypothetical protein